jgi:hypothetical protein
VQATIPDLWSDDIKVDVVQPVVILRTQAGLLEKKTRGVLRSEVTTTRSPSGEVLGLDLLAPALNGYRKTLLTAAHAADMIYPLLVTSEALRALNRSPHTPPGAISMMADLLLKNHEKEVSSQDEFIDTVRTILRSGYVRALISSLIAKSNEVTSTQNGRVEANEAETPGE